MEEKLTEHIRLTKMVSECDCHGQLCNTRIFGIKANILV